MPGCIPGRSDERVKVTVQRAQKSAVEHAEGRTGKYFSFAGPFPPGLKQEAWWHPFKGACLRVRAHACERACVCVCERRKRRCAFRLI